MTEKHQSEQKLPDPIASLAPTSLLSRANITFRSGNYNDAVILYEEALRQSTGILHQQIFFNLQLARKKLGAYIQRNDHGLEKPESLDGFYFDLIQQGNFFNKAWYLTQYKEKYQIKSNPLAHYLQHGVELSLNPSPDFDTAYYLSAHIDVATSGMHPFLHYVCQGHKENRPAKPYSADLNLDDYEVEKPFYVPRLATDVPPVEKAARVIAFYLPQFHPIPENDAWWGKGFTEWTNVKPAKPQFEGHYQPHVPDDYLGYYDLRDTDVMRKQIELAKQYGIEGFCFYTYWFTGHRLLEAPVDNYLADPSLDLPFCICWANENWSRRWDGLDQDLLMEQHYSPEDDVNFIAHMSKYLRDPRYIRVGGKPLMVVYRPNLFPSMKDTALRWRDWCRSNGLGEIYISYVQSFEKRDPAYYGLDAAIEFPPNNSSPPEIYHKVSELLPEFTGKVYDWRIFLKRSENYEKHAHPLFRGVCPSWDNTARKKERSTVFAHSSPKLFERWLVSILEETQSRIQEPDQRIVFINAWNEWAEGAHLEADKRHGYAWLQAVRQAHMAVANSCQRILIVSHDAHPHGAQLLSLNMAKHFKHHLGFQVDMIVLGEGKLLPSFQEQATVHRIDLATDSLSQIDSYLSKIRRQGLRAAIVNTTVAGQLVPHLKRHDFSVLTLVHELPGILASYQLLSQAQAIAQQADKIVFAAPQVKQGFESFIGQSLHQAIIRPQGLYQRSWLRDGADKNAVRQQIRQQLGITSEARIILGAGYADQRKGFDLFVQAATRVMRQMGDVYALWVGHTDQGFVETSMAYAEQHGLRSHFLFTGLVVEPQPYYLAADVYALTSREDPFPSVVMEAFDALTPVVAFKDCGGFEELLKRGCGALAPKEDVSAFAEKIKTLIENPSQALHMAQRGREIVEQEFNFRHYLFDLLAYACIPIPTVSAIVPNYNYARYLKDRLETVTNQTLPLYELIVLDDCSTDDSQQVIQNFLSQCDLPWRLELNETNSGSVFRQWRKGVELAKGKYVWIAEADDTCKPQFLQRVVSRMQEAGAILGFADSWQIDEDGKHLGDSYKPYVNEEAPGAFDQYFVMEGREFLTRHLGIKNIILNVSGVVFRRDALLAALDRVGDELYEYKVAGDWRLYIDLCATNLKVVFEAEPLNGHRRHQSSVTHTLEAQNHLKEIEGMHRLVNEKLSSQLIKDNQMKYLQHVAQYLNQS
jgi:glycosyltransferase involved in cell wall biosynthesis